MKQSTKDKYDFLEYMKSNHTGDYPLLRKLMSSQEIKFANQLCKEKLLCKGKSDDKSHNVIFYYEKSHIES